MAGVIRIDEGVSDYHVARIRQASDDLPGASTITEVMGNRGDDASKAYAERLDDASAQIAQRVDAIREFVVNNADALAHAVAMLRERDAMSADEARRAAAVLGDLMSIPSSEAGSGARESDTSASRAGFGR